MQRSLSPPTLWFLLPLLSLTEVWRCTVQGLMFWKGRCKKTHPNNSLRAHKRPSLSRLSLLHFKQCEKSVCEICFYYLLSKALLNGTCQVKMTFKLLVEKVERFGWLERKWKKWATLMQAGPVINFRAAICMRERWDQPAEQNCDLTTLNLFIYL